MGELIAEKSVPANNKLTAADLTREEVSWRDGLQPLEPVFKGADTIDPIPRIQIKPSAPIRLTAVEEDVAAIKRTASAITELFTEATVSNYIAQGQAYKKLHGELARNDKADTSRIGWYAAFEQNILQHSRRQAEDLIAICDAFVGTAVPSKLPRGLRPLRLLARLLKQERLTRLELQGYLDTGAISALSTEVEIREVLGLRRTRGGQTGKTDTPDIQSIPVRKLLQQLTSDQRRELIAVAFATFRAACGRWPGTPITLRQGARVIEDSRRLRLA